MQGETLLGKKIGIPLNDTVVNSYIAEVLSQNDYYPFGMMMPGRTYTAGSSYRYGFNGKEQDPETYGEGNIYDYGFRIYNPRLGKFLSVDPLMNEYPELTPYQFASNTPIIAIDLDGLEAVNSNDKRKNDVKGNNLFNPDYVSRISNLNAFNLQTQIVDDIYNKIEKTIAGDAQSTIRTPDEILTIKTTIRQFIIVNPGFYYEFQEVAFVIPTEQMDVKEIAVAKFKEFRDSDLGGNYEDNYVKDPLKKTFKSSAIQFTKLSGLAKDKNNKYALSLFGKSFNLLSKTIKVWDLLETIYNAPKDLQKGEIPVIGTWIQSNPAQVTEEDLINSTISAFRKYINAVFYQKVEIKQESTSQQHSDNTRLQNSVEIKNINN